MTAVLIFTVPEPVDVVIVRCRKAIAMVGAPLKSDSGHFITGVMTSGHNNVEIRVTWLPDPTGTQITVNASHENVSEEELENVAQRFKYQYFHSSDARPKSCFRVSGASILFLAGALAAIVLFVFAMIKHKS